MNQSALLVTHCPNCGSGQIHRVVDRWQGEFRGQPYTVEALEHFVCPSCGERVFSPEAMRRIQAVSPAFARHSRKPAA